MAKPDKFIVLKVIKSALEFIRLEGETESKASLPKLLSKLDGKLRLLGDCVYDAVCRRASAVCVATGR